MPLPSLLFLCDSPMTHPTSHATSADATPFDALLAGNPAHAWMGYEQGTLNFVADPTDRSCNESNAESEKPAPPLSAAALIEQYGSPLYVTNIDQVVQRGEALLAALPFPVQGYYAVKANPRRGLLEALAPRWGADVVSVGEAHAATAAGIAPSAMIYSGVGKSDTDIETAIRMGIGQINAESIEEVAAIRACAERVGRKAKVGLRVNPDVRADTLAQISTGSAGDKFGIQIEAVPMVYRALHSPENVDGLIPGGLAVHIGSQMQSLVPLEAAVMAIATLAMQLLAEGLAVPCLDLGGGLGIRYKDETPPSPTDYAAALTKGLAPARARIDAGEMAIAIEPGRWLVGPAGVLLSRVMRTKAPPMRLATGDDDLKPGDARAHAHDNDYDSDNGDAHDNDNDSDSDNDKNSGNSPSDIAPIALLDAGMHTLMRPALYDAWHHIVPVVSQAVTTPYRIAGPVCESTDTWATPRLLPATLQAGDAVAVLDAGAYGSSMANAYNLFGLPAEVGIYRGRPVLLRPHMTPEALIAEDLPLGT